VVTKRHIAESLGMEYFNTFGGCNLACAFGEATLDVLLEERLMDNARDVGAFTLVRPPCPPCHQKRSGCSMLVIGPSAL
jgi:4-aminobutyrate aminotransferase-like enzyme